MSAGGDVYDISDYQIADKYDNAAMRAGLQIFATPTSRGDSPTAVGSPALRYNTIGGGMMNKGTVRSVAYFMIVGGIVVWIVGHLAPLRA